MRYINTSLRAVYLTVAIPSVVALIVTTAVAEDVWRYLGGYRV
jgi:hypothetical protein